MFHICKKKRNHAKVMIAISNARIGLSVIALLND